VKSSRPRLEASLAALLAALSLAAAAAAALPRTELRSGAHTFIVEVASTPQQRGQGLKGRTRLDDDAGMLFVFERKDRHCFWMKDTPLPLSIAFLADDGRIVNLADMQPQTTDLHCAEAPVRYALEVKQGAFRSKNIRPGTRFTGGPFDRSL
jgi:uncharacterized protein